MNPSNADSAVVPLRHLRSRPPVTRAAINVRNLRLRTYIGFNPEEQAKQQDVVLNLEVTYRPRPGVIEDCVDDALDYKQITKKVIEHVERGRFLLLERLVADVLAICADHPDIDSARVTIDKPHALRFADSVSLTLHHHASDNGNNREDPR